jgi:hypothetical protein
MNNLFTTQTALAETEQKLSNNPLRKNFQTGNVTHSINLFRRRTT